MATRTPKPISPALHGLIDYGVAAADLALPSLLGMSGRARAVFAAFGLVQGGLNSVTAQPYALDPVVSLQTHRLVDLAAVPVVLGLPPVLGLHREPRARAFWVVLAGSLVAVYLLTDWEAGSTAR
jgi:hypothetical protein